MIGAAVPQGRWVEQSAAVQGGCRFMRWFAQCLLRRRHSQLASSLHLIAGCCCRFCCPCAKAQHSLPPAPTLLQVLGSSSEPRLLARTSSQQAMKPAVTQLQGPGAGGAYCGLGRASPG